MRGLVLASAILLSACANQQVTELGLWSVEARQHARNGQIHWSDYYKELYQRVSSLPEMNGKGFYLSAANVLIDASMAMENGLISVAQFESFQREMAAAESQYAEQVRARNSAALAQASMAYSAFLQAQAAQAGAWRAGQPFTCVSYQAGIYTNVDCQ